MITQLRQQEFVQRLNECANAEPQKLIPKNNDRRIPHIVYVMTHVNICGGSKIIFEHANHLQKHGAKVTIISHFPKPTWFPLVTDYFRVPFGVKLASGIPNCDVIVATYWDHIQECIDVGIAPVVYFEQGDAHLFDVENLNPQIQQFVKRMFELPPYIITVSKHAQDCIQKIYSRNSTVFLNALNQEVFKPEGVKHQSQRPYLLMVGGDQVKFKGLHDIIDAYELVINKGFELDLVWITPQEPSNYVNDVSEIFVNPPQHKIAELYRGALMYISASYYESFQLPGLEAMACGCPVITTDNTGAKEYAIHNENALFIQIGNPEQLAQNIELLVNDSNLRARLASNGLLTAQRFSWSNTIPMLLGFYNDMETFGIQPRNNEDEFDILCSKEQFLSEDDYERFHKFLRFTLADEVEVPLLYPLIDGHLTARWQTVAIRKTRFSNRKERYYCKIKGYDEVFLPYEKAYGLYLEKNYYAAFGEFTQLVNSEPDAKGKLVYLRWAILSLMEMGQLQKALELIMTTLQNTKNNSDLYYLAYLIYSAMDFDQDKLKEIVEVIQALGEAVEFPEFIAELDGIVTQQT